MNGKRARMIRKQVYGEENSSKFIKHRLAMNRQNTATGSIVADHLRRMYKALKYAHTRQGSMT